MCTRPQPSTEWKDIIIRHTDNQERTMALCSTKYYVVAIKWPNTHTHMAYCAVYIST